MEIAGKAGPGLLQPARAGDGGARLRKLAAEDLRLRRPIARERSQVGEHGIDLRHRLFRSLEHLHGEQLLERRWLLLGALSLGWNLVALVLYTFPVLVMAINVACFGERLTRTKLGAALLTMIGLAITVAFIVQLIILGALGFGPDIDQFELQPVVNVQPTQAGLAPPLRFDASHGPAVVQVRGLNLHAGQVLAVVLAVLVAGLVVVAFAYVELLHGYQKERIGVWVRGPRRCCPRGPGLSPPRG